MKKVREKEGASSHLAKMGRGAPFFSIRGCGEQKDTMQCVHAHFGISRKQ
jgi:hypothetical protein